MLIRRIEDCETFTAGDGTSLKELLHPDKEALAIRYSLAHATLPPQAASRPHRLATTEVYYILSGEGLMHIDEEENSVRGGDVVYIPPGATQWIKNTGNADLTFLCIVDPAWRITDEEVLQ